MSLGRICRCCCRCCANQDEQIITTASMLRRRQYAQIGAILADIWHMRAGKLLAHTMQTCVYMTAQFDQSRRDETRQQLEPETNARARAILHGAWPNSTSRLAALEQRVTLPTRARVCHILARSEQRRPICCAWLRALGRSGGRRPCAARVVSDALNAARKCVSSSSVPMPFPREPAARLSRSNMTATTATTTTRT